MYMPVCTQTGCTWTENTVTELQQDLSSNRCLLYARCCGFHSDYNFGDNYFTNLSLQTRRLCSEKVYDASTISQPCFGWGGFQVELTNVCIPKPYPEWRVVLHIHWLIWGQIREKGLTSSFTLRWTWNPLGICAREILTQPWQWAWEDSQVNPGCFSVRCQEDKEGLPFLVQDQGAVWCMCL